MKKITKIIICCAVLAAVVILFCFGIWAGKNRIAWNNMISEANKSDLYSKQTNGVDNRKLVDIAVQYIKTAGTVTFDGVDRKIDDQKLVKIDFDAGWFSAHAPENIEYNYDSNGLYDVYWRFMPGCEKRWAEKAGVFLWYRPDGIQCAGGWTVEVLIDKGLNAQKINIETLK